MIFGTKKEYPLIPLRNEVIFPGTTVPVVFKSSYSQIAVEESLHKGRMAVLAWRKRNIQGQISLEDIHSMGTLVKILENHKMPDGTIIAMVEGQARVKIENIFPKDNCAIVEVREILDVEQLTLEGEALLHNIEDYFKKCVALGMSIPTETLSIIFSSPRQSAKIDLIAFSLSLEVSEKQKILEEISLKERLELVDEAIRHKLEVLQVAKKIEKKTNESINKVQREAILHEQLKAIQKELGMGERADITELKKKIEKAEMPEKVKKVAQDELERLIAMPSFSPEISYIRTYLDWLVSLPWGIKSKTELDISKAEKFLNEDHYGLTDVKERILEHLAVCKLAKKIRGPILCFAGPPGTGKTSVGKSIARAMGRKFVRMSLGGIRDEAEIRGHRRTYVGALPGRIIQGVKNAGANNPIFMLDEIDKIGADFRGDPSSALLEALDPEQNFAFSDHYIELPFDLSDVMFVATANVLDTIPPALRDRMEIIEFPGYTEEEKFHIAKKFLMPKLIAAHGLDSKKFTITDEAIREVATGYTREAGVRNLERELAKLCRKIAKKITEDSKEAKKNQVIGPKDLHQYLGPIVFQPTLAEKKDEVGVATGLAWTSAGGEILFIESTKMPGKGNLILTGHLGEVMKESAQAAFSYARSHCQELKINKDFYKNFDLHIHVPAGATPKDGPSAGVAMAISLISCLTDRSTKREVGMTGEITLRGKVLEIGGVKEKILAAHRAGLKKIILPAENKKDLEKLPEKVKKDLQFIFVKHIDEAIKVVLNK
ncbi:MAG: endopeptidase La [Patescibacteria group bacterium]